MILFLVCTVKLLDWGEEGTATIAETAALRASFKQEFLFGTSLITQMLPKLSYLHSKKIVHRDVKAENMLLDYHRTLKIADFGVARVEAQNPRDMTGETGTLGYMAPEVLDGKPYNRKCDVYSFGVCLWETYCCDLPYTDLSFAEVSYAVVKQ
ncbi:UNVERIFIED_CONTAM: Serine/threonine-protein kinase STY8, partial [Sesamum angustifolium]